MGKARIDKERFGAMVREGRTGKEIAEYFNVTQAAVSLARKQLKGAVVRSVVMENAHKVLNKELDIVSQLQKINENANEILDLLMRWNRGDDEALRNLETQVRKVKAGRGENAEEVTEYRLKDPRELALKAMAEIRGQLDLQLSIFAALYDMAAVCEFQEEVLNAIEEVDPETKSRIVQKLQERKFVRRIIRAD